MCTVFLIRTYKPTPGHVFTINFDETTYPHRPRTAKPYTIKYTEPNQTQDCRYDPGTKNSIPSNNNTDNQLNSNCYLPSAKMRAQQKTNKPKTPTTNKLSPQKQKKGHTLLPINTQIPKYRTNHRMQIKPIYSNNIPIIEITNTAASIQLDFQFSTAFFC